MNAVEMVTACLRHQQGLDAPVPTEGAREVDSLPDPSFYLAPSDDGIDGARPLAYEEPIQ